MKNKTSFEKTQENLHLINPEILYFNHFEVEKIEFEGQISKILKNDKFSIYRGWIF